MKETGAGSKVRRNSDLSCRLVCSLFMIQIVFAFCTAFGADEVPTPLTVYVTYAPVEAVKKIDKATEDMLIAKRDEAKTEAEKVEKDLKNQYGKKKENWPADALEKYYQAEQNAAIANANYEYKKVEPVGLENSATDLIESIQGKGMTAEKKNVSIVKTADEAQIVVEVIGRRSGRSGTGALFGGIRPDRYYVCFTLGPGKKMDPAQFTQLPHNWHFKKFGYSAWELSFPGPDSPFFTFESYAEQGWGHAANTGAFLIDQFIRDNYKTLSGTN